MKEGKRVLKAPKEIKKCTKKASNSEVINEVLKKLNQIKKLCVEIYGGDEDLLLKDIKQQSIEDVIKNSGNQKDLNITKESTPPPPITQEEIGKLVPLNLNGKIKSKQQIYDNIDLLVQRSEKRKLYLYKQSQLQKQEKEEKVAEEEKDDDAKQV